MIILPTAIQPTKDEKPRVWATEIVGRRPLFKTYTNIGHAKTAVKYHAPHYVTSGLHVTNNAPRYHFAGYYARVFELVQGQWIHRPEWSWEAGDPPIEW